VIRVVIVQGGELGDDRAVDAGDSGALERPGEHGAEVREAEEELGGGAQALGVEGGEDAGGAVAAAGAEDRVDAGVGEGVLEGAQAAGVVAREEAVALPEVGGEGVGAREQGAEAREAGFDAIAWDRAGGGDDVDPGARAERGGAEDLHPWAESGRDLAIWWRSGMAAEGSKGARSSVRKAALAGMTPTLARWRGQRRRPARTLAPPFGSPRATAIMFNALIKKVFGTKHERQMKRLQPMVNRISELEPSMKALSDADLRGQTARFRERLSAGEPLDELIPEAFAAVREASVRALGMRHYDVQMVGGLGLAPGKIAEMRTGEGKTLTATRRSTSTRWGPGAHLDHGQRLPGQARRGVDGPDL
jgi:hypothetical protein